MAYLGNQPVVGDSANTFKLLDDISTFTLTFDGSSTNVVSVANDTLTFANHRFITGQKVTYTDGGGTVITGLTDGTSYFIIKVDQNTIKLATNASNAASSTAIDLTGVGAGTSHTLKVAFDGVNTKFKATHTNGIKASISRAAQLSLSINGVIQQPTEAKPPTVGYGIEPDSTIVFSTAPVATDKVFGTFIGEVAPSFDLTDNTVDNFTGDGSTTTFTLSRETPSSQDVLITLDGVTQHPSDASTTRSYSVVNQGLSFTSAPADGVAIQARHIGFAGATTSAVTGFYGRTGNVALTSTDDISVQNISAGIITATTFGGNPSFTGNVSIGGTLTYEDVTNIDAVGLITARQGIKIGTGVGVAASISVDGNAEFSGIATVNNELHIPDYIHHVGDNNCKFGFESGDTFAIETAGSERFRVDSSGNVNLGAEAANTAIQASGPFSGATPKLEVKLGGASNSYTRLINIANPSGATGSETLGRVGIKLALGSESNSTETAKAGIIYAESTSNFNNSTSLCFATNNTERLRIDSSGRLLLGTTTEGQADADNLTIADSGSCGITIRSGTSAAGAIYFSDATSGAAEYDGAVIYNQSSQYMDFYTAQSPRIRIKSNGIIVSGNSGTSFGNAAIQAFIAHGNTAGESGFSSVDTTSVAAGVGGEIAFHGKYNTGAQDYAYLGHIRGIKENATAGNTACSLTFHTRPDATSPQERVRITSGGIVNISSTGNSLDQTGYRFQLTGSGGGEAASMAIKNEGSHPAKLHLQSGHGNWSISNSASVADALEIRDESANALRAIFTNTGYVGINRSTPEHYLDVDGTSLFRDRLYFGTAFLKSSPFGVNVTFDTGISVNAGGYGGSMLCLCSRNYSAGTGTQAALYFLHFYYDGNNQPTKHYLGGAADFATFGKSGSNTLTVAMGASNNMFTVIASSVS